MGGKPLWDLSCCNVYRRRWKQVMRPPPACCFRPPPALCLCCSFIQLHTCTLLSIRSQLDMPPKASAAGQHTTKQGTSARTGHSKVLTHGVDSASLKRVREGSLVSLDMFLKKNTVGAPSPSLKCIRQTGTSAGRVVCSACYKEEPCRLYVLRQGTRGRR